MSSVQWSVKLWNRQATRLVVVFVMVVQVLGLRAGWPQEPVQPRIKDEFAKQAKIYGSRGADVPSGYVTGRTLSDYAGILPTGFCAALGKLGDQDRWLDIGAGEGQAIVDYYAPPDELAPTEKCGGSSAKARAVAMSIEDRRTDAWQQLATNVGDDRIRYLFGKRLRQYPREELGKFQMITDVYGGFSYTDDLSGFMERALNLLEVGGAFYTIVQGVHLEDGKDKSDTYYQTELVDSAGRDVKVCSWLKQTACVQVSCESKSEWDAPTELISMRKVCSEVSVPPVKLVKFEAGNPPTRRFQSEAKGDGVKLIAPARVEQN